MSSGTPRRRTSPTSACTRFSTAGRSRRASSRATVSTLRFIREMGHVNEIFTADRLAHLPGLGRHRPRPLLDRRRFSSLKNAQPIAVDYAGGSVAIAHNGNLVNVSELRAPPGGRGVDLPDHLRHRGDPAPDRPLARGRTLPERLADALRQVRGAYSLAVLTAKDMLIAVRDPMGFRPLSLGKVRGRLGGRLRDLRLRADRGRASSATSSRARWWSSTRTACAACARSAPRRRGAACSSGSTSRARTRPSTALSVYRARENMGRRLALEHPVDADVVIPVPDSGTAAAIGYARESGIPFGQGLMRSHYVGRTFIEPSQSDPALRREAEAVAGARGAGRQAGGGGRRLHRARHHLAQDHRDDPRRPGAREIHMRISSPPTVGPCHYGIDTPSRDELIASSQSVGARSASSSAPTRSATCRWRACTPPSATACRTDPNHGLCDACFSNQYPDHRHPAGPPAAAAADLRLTRRRIGRGGDGHQHHLGRGRRRAAPGRRRAGRAAWPSCASGSRGR